MLHRDLDVTDLPRCAMTGIARVCLAVWRQYQSAGFTVAGTSCDLILQRQLAELQVQIKSQPESDFQALMSLVDD